MSNIITSQTSQQLLSSQSIEFNKITSPEEKLSEVEEVDNDIRKIADRIQKGQERMNNKLDEMIKVLEEKLNQNKSANNSFSQIC